MICVVSLKNEYMLKSKFPRLLPRLYEEVYNHVNGILFFRFLQIVFTIVKFNLASFQHCRVNT